MRNDGRKPGPAMPASVAYTEPDLDVYVPPGDSSVDTAILLTGTADEYGIPQSQIRYDGRGGYWISDALADIVYSDMDDEDDITQTPDSADAETGSNK